MELINKNTTEASLCSIFTTTYSAYCGISLAEIHLPQKCAFLGIIREGKIITIKQNPTVHPGDHILAIAKSPIMLPALEVTLKKIYSVH